MLDVLFCKYVFMYIISHIPKISPDVQSIMIQKVNHTYKHTDPSLVKFFDNNTGYEDSRFCDTPQTRQKKFLLTQ